MRDDIQKAIVERPRTGGRTPLRSRGDLAVGSHYQTLGEDALDDRRFLRRQDAELGSVRKRWKIHNHDYKQFSDLLAPLTGWLRKQEGRPFDKVLSEAKQHLRGGGTLQRHVLGHLYQKLWDVTGSRWGAGRYGLPVFWVFYRGFDGAFGSGNQSFVSYTDYEETVMVVLPGDPQRRLVRLDRFLKRHGVTRRERFGAEMSRKKAEKARVETLSTVERGHITYRYQQEPTGPGWWLRIEAVQGLDPVTKEPRTTYRNRRVGSKERKRLKLPANPLASD